MLTQTRFFGIDLAKRDSQLCTLDKDANIIKQLRFASTKPEFEKLALELTEHDTVAFEMTTNSFAIARLFKQLSNARVIVSNPIKTKLIASAKIKTDKIDAKILAELARVSFLPEVWLPDEQTESLRRLVSRRLNLVARRTELKNDCHAVLHRNLIDYTTSDLFGVDSLKLLRSVALPKLERLLVDEMLDEIEELNKRIERTEQTIAAFICADEKLLSQMDLLLTIDGISIVTGSGILSAIGDVSRFSSPKKLASYFGLVPSSYQSGELKTYHGRITKRGRAEARWFLIEAAESLRKSHCPLKKLYERVCKKKNHNVAVVAVARKLAELIWHLLTKNEPYLYQKHRLTQEKQSRLRFMAKQNGVLTKSASPTTKTNESALKGMKIEGRKFKDEVSRSAAERASKIYEAVVENKLQLKEIEGFNPVRPTQHDYERLIKEVIGEMLPQKLKK